MDDKKELTIEEKARKLEKYMNHALSLFSNADERFQTLERSANDLYNNFDNGYNKKELVKELTEVTARVIRNNYKNEQEKINDMIKQAYITGKLESMKDTMGYITKIINDISSLKPFTSWKEPMW